MKSFLYERKISGLITSIVTLALGLVFIIEPLNSVRYACMAFGIFLSIFGISFLVSYFLGKSAISVFQLNLILGIILLIIGVWLIIKPDVVIALVQYVFGVYILLHSAIDLQASFAAKTFNFKYWYLFFISSLIAVVLACFILFAPIASFETLVILIGIVLMFTGLFELALIIILLVFARKFKKQINEKVQVIDAKYSETTENLKSENKSTSL